MVASNGAVVWRGPSTLDQQPIVVIATSLRRRAAYVNGKTGDCVQTWIIREDISPFDALRSRDDASVCGDCALRPQGPPGPSHGRACYVHSGMVDNIFKAHSNGKYAPLKPGLMAGRIVRLGSYGDPAAVPIHVWRALLTDAAGWVGYTHAWRYCTPELRQFCMASVDTPLERKAAIAAGWRTFRTRFNGEPLLANEIACPAAAEAGKKTTCEECVLCDGVQYTPDQRRNIAIINHGWPPAMRAYSEVRGMLHSREAAKAPKVIRRPRATLNVL